MIGNARDTQDQPLVRSYQTIPTLPPHPHLKRHINWPPCRKSRPEKPILARLIAPTPKLRVLRSTRIIRVPAIGLQNALEGEVTVGASLHPRLICAVTSVGAAAVPFAAMAHYVRAW